MLTYEYGDPAADVILIQPVDDHDLAEIELEQAAVREQIATGIGSQFDKEIGTLMLELIDEDKRYILHEYRKRTDAQNTEAAN